MLTPSNNSQHHQERPPSAVINPTAAPLRDSPSSTDSTFSASAEAQLLHTIEVAKRFGRKTAHDFNNIMAVIHGFAVILQKRLQQDEANRSIAEQIESSALEALKLTAWLSAFGNNRPWEMLPLDFNEVVAEAVGSIWKEKPDGIDLEVELAPEPLLMVGDEAQLQNMCLSLWSNAVEAMPQGGKVRWQTSLEKSPPRSVSGPEDHHGVPYLRLRVSDTGVGMDQETRSSMFEPFFSTKNGKDRGLGLSTVYDTVHSHEGMIGVSSEPGAGACVDVFFPAQVPEVSEQQPSGPAAGPEVAKLLVVDDEEMILEMVEHMLRGQGCEVVTVVSGEAALEAFQQSKGAVKAVILDMTLPGINGLETFQKLKELDQKVRVILSTGDPHQKAVHDAMDQGAFGVLSKPFLADHLLEVVKQALG